MIPIRCCPLYALLALLCLASSPIASTRSLAATPPPPDVLVINSYAPGYAWSDDMLRGLLVGLHRAHAEFEPITVFLDYRRFGDPQRDAWLIEDIAYKCRVRPPKLIITLDNAAFDFALRHRSQLGEEIPLVFGGLNQFDYGMIAGQRAITGVSEETDFSGTFQLIRTLRPHTRQILVIGNATESSRAKRRSFEKYAPVNARGMTFEFYENWTNAQLIERVATLPDDWVGLILDVTRDASGENNYNNPDFSTALATRARVPVFLTSFPPGDNDWSKYQWDGLGGGLVVAREHGDKVAELAVRVLAGESADTVPVVTASPQRLIVDFRQLRRYGLNLSDLPVGTTVVNQPATSYQINRERIVQTGILVVALCAVIAVLSFNILRRKKAEHALRQAEERLRSAQKLEAVGLLAGGVAHDFNNILQIIRGHSEFLRETVAHLPEAKDDLATISSATDRASQLTRQLLAFGRKQPLQIENLDPNELVGSVVKMLRRILGEHIDLNAELLAEPVTLVADRSQIEQVLINLCVNARDAMPGGGLLAIKLAPTEVLPGRDGAELPPGLYLSILVKDSGQGMTPEVKARLFEPFYTTKTIGKGTGLGLAVVHGIVHQHKGSITVTSAPGQGTAFRILLPVSRGAGAASSRAVIEKPPVGHGTIMLAEDDPQVRRVTCRFLEMGGFKVITAADGQEARELIQRHQAEIRLAVLDVIMPKTNGREVYDFIRSHHPHIRVLFSSGYSADMLPPESAPEGEVEVLSKPYVHQELLGRIQHILQKRS